MGLGMERSGDLIDGFGRRITYVRLSVTDRCDLRCRYCMAEQMEFLPRQELLTRGELAGLSDIFIERGVTQIRLTGGEPLVRRNVIDLIRHLGRRIGEGLNEVTLTTNGAHLEALAKLLADAGVRRINVSLDTLRFDRFRHITQRGDLDKVLRGLAEARHAGIKVRVNMVALKGINDDEFVDMLAWCGGEGHDLCLIETLPLGEGEDRREDLFLPLDAVRRQIEHRFTLVPSLDRTGGPARCYEVRELGNRPDHASEQQFLCRVQPHWGHRPRNDLRLPWSRAEGRAQGNFPHSRPSRRRGSARAPARQRAGAAPVRHLAPQARGRSAHECNSWIILASPDRVDTWLLRSSKRWKNQHPPAMSVSPTIPTSNCREPFSA